MDEQTFLEYSYNPYRNSDEEWYICIKGIRGSKTFEYAMREHKIKAREKFEEFLNLILEKIKEESSQFKDGK